MCSSDLVLRSWVRSKEGARLHALRQAPSLGQDELNNLRSRNTRLREAAKLAVRRTGYMLDDAGAMLLLCDQKGVVLEAAGDARVLSRGAENHLQPGGRWDEAAIGTNAIGTALHLGKPVSITGVEHFCEAIHHWSCAAAPIHDPVTGKMLGVVDISAPAQERMRRGAALSVSLALQIEEALRALELQEREALIGHLLSSGMGAGRGGDMAVFDRYGRQVWASGASERLSTKLGPATAGLAEAPAFEGDPHLLAERFSAALPEAGVDLILSRGEALGLVVSFPIRRRGERKDRIDLPAIAGIGSMMAPICDEAAKLVESGVPLVIKGQAGSGKETLARALHEAGPQARMPLELVDCSLLEPAMLRGAPGGEWLARLSDGGGTLILDEPVETPLPVQVALAQSLAQLQRAAPVQVISLSSVPLSERLAAERLRADLHFRLSGAVLRLPSLAERRADLPDLVRHFSETCSDRRKGVVRFTPAAMLRLQAYDWPGNLRELRNLVEALSATSFSRLVDAADLPPAIARGRRPGREETLRDRERVEILDAVAACGGNMTETARRLGISRSTLYLKLEQYGVPRARKH